MKPVFHKLLFAATTISVVFIVYFLLNDNTITLRERYSEFLHRKYLEMTKQKDKNTEQQVTTEMPEEALVHEFVKTLDPALGYVPDERLVAAYHYTVAMQKEYASRSGITWQEIHSRMGGRTRTLMYDPSDASGKKVWAGGVTGGLWYNNNITDPTSVWNPVNDFWSNLAVNCITYDPNNKLIMYVGTGEAQTATSPRSRRSGGKGIGILKSTDGGNSWFLLNSTGKFAFITKIVVRNENSNSVVYAGVVSGKIEGINATSDPSDGLYRSTDAGQTWTQVLPNITNLDQPYAPSDVCLSADGRIFVGTGWDINRQGAATILYSDLGTAGSWTVFENYKNSIESAADYKNPGRVILAPSPSSANTIYAFIAASNATTFRCEYIIRTTNKGTTWETLNNMNNGSWANFAWFAMIAAVDPNNASRLYIGGLDLNTTSNGGSNWTKVTQWNLMYSNGGDQYVHADQHAIVYKPGSSTEAIFGCDGGVFYTSTASNTEPVFQEMNNQYNTLQFYTCDINPILGKNEYIGGLQDNCSLIFTGDDFAVDNNSILSGGDGGFCFYDKNEPQYIITSYVFNAYYFIDLSQSAVINSCNDNQSGYFINPCDLDDKLNILFSNANNINNSYPDQMVRMTNIFSQDNLNVETIDVNTGTSATFSAIKYSPFSPSGKSTLFAGTIDGQLFKITEAQETPVSTSIGSAGFPTAFVSCIETGGSEDTLLVTFSNYGVSSIWQTYNGGVTWQEKEGNLPDMPIRWAIYHPKNTRQALIATETGVWATYNLHETNVSWIPATQGLANVRVDMLKIRKSDLKVVAATHGRGLFTTTFDYNPVGLNEATGNQLSFTIYPNPCHGIINIQFTGAENNHYTVQVINSSGQVVYNKKTSGEGAKKIDLTDHPKGIYLIKCLNGEKTYQSKIIME